MKYNRTLWTIQVLLAGLFLFAGSAKLVIPLDQLSGPVHLPGAFLRFIGGAEVLGAIGLVLPWLLEIRTQLTPVAAGGLLIIMIGAVVVTASAGSVAGCLIPGCVGVALATVMYGRTQALAI